MKTAMMSLVIVAWACVAVGDQLVVTGQTKEGTFQGYGNARFQFVTSKGRMIREQAPRVMKLVLKAPQKVTYETSDGKAEEKAVFQGYDKRNFVLLKGGKEVLIPQGKMKTISPVFEGEGGEMGGVQREGNRYPVPNVDLAALAQGEPTAAQKAAIDKFTAAKQGFDAYVAKSSELVRAMDQATGVKREDLLNELRARKNEEQPLKRALEAAYDNLADAFPKQAGAEE